MTMMATQEPTDPSVLLNSHSNNSNSMNTDITTNTATTTSSSTSSTNGTISHTLLKELPSTSPSPIIGNIRSNQTSATSYTTANHSATPSCTGTNGSHQANTTTPSTTLTATTSSTSTAMLMSATRTPPRSSLANDPNLTPIASIKRPRANLLKSHSSSTVATPQQQQLQPMLLSPTTTTTPQMSPKPSSTRYGTAVDDSTPLSPMHKIKPVLHRDTVPVTKSNSTLTTSNANPATNATSIDSPSHPEGFMIKEKVDELFSPVVQFLHDHEHQHHTDSDNQHAVPRVSKSTSDDLSIELDLGGTSTQHYNSDNDDEEVYADAEDGVVVENNEVVDDDDVSMSRPEQHDYANEGEFNPWQFIASLPPYESVVVHRPPVTLPPLVEYGMKATGRSSLSSPRSLLRKTLVLDLDETLVHCSVTEPADHIVDFTFPVQFHGETYSVHVKCRPYLQQFLNEVCQHFEVIVFTASQKVYADALLNILDPNGRCIHHRLFRESCLAVEGNYLKDLNVLGRDLRRTVLVDNSPHAFGYQVSNGIPIESWFDCPNDRELVKLQRFLLSQVLPAEDVRVPVREKFQSHILIATAPPFPS